MNHGIRKGLSDIAYELKAIRNTLNAIWHSQHNPEESKTLSPEAYADEYISTEECARRLGVSDQTIRNWIAVGRKHPEKGWQEGLHYVNVTPDPEKKVILRIPWNALIESFSRNKAPLGEDLYKKQKMYQRTSLSDLDLS